MKTERELFEAWYLNHYYTRNGITPDENKFKTYYDGKNWCYLYDSVFRAWTAWQASAQREGYRLVPVETLEECLFWSKIAEWDSPDQKTDDEISKHVGIIEKAMTGAAP